MFFVFLLAVVCAFANNQKSDYVIAENHVAKQPSADDGGHVEYYQIFTEEDEREYYQLLLEERDEEAIVNAKLSLAHKKQKHPLNGTVAAQINESNSSLQLPETSLGAPEWPGADADLNRTILDAVAGRNLSADEQTLEEELIEEHSFFDDYAESQKSVELPEAVEAGREETFEATIEIDAKTMEEMANVVRPRPKRHWALKITKYIKKASKFYKKIIKPTLTKLAKLGRKMQKLKRLAALKAKALSLAATLMLWKKKLVEMAKTFKGKVIAIYKRALKMARRFFLQNIQIEKTITLTPSKVKTVWDKFNRLSEKREDEPPVERILERTSLKLLCPNATGTIEQQYILFVNGVIPLVESRYVSFGEKFVTIDPTVKIDSGYYSCYINGTFQGHVSIEVIEILEAIKAGLINYFIVVAFGYAVILVSIVVTCATWSKARDADRDWLFEDEQPPTPQMEKKRTKKKKRNNPDRQLVTKVIKATLRKRKPVQLKKPKQKKGKKTKDGKPKPVKGGRKGGRSPTRSSQRSPTRSSQRSQSRSSRRSRSRSPRR